MSSSQTMTAPAVGHRPPDAGPNMSSIYDYGRSQQPDDHRSPSPPSDSAIRALNDSAPDPPDAPSNGLTSPSGIMPVKSEPDENAFPPSAVEQSSQTDTRRQSAASALLAQLLGNQSSMPSDGPGPSAEHSVPAAQDTNQPQDIDDGMNGQWSTDAPAGTTAMSSDPTGGQDQIPANSNELPESQQEQKNSDQPPEVPFSNPDGDLNISLKHADPSEGLTDPLLFSKSGLDHSDLFTPFDITGAAKDPFEALQQNEMLTAAYLSQSADLSALGYSGGHLQDTGSIAGSEPRIQAFAKLEFDDGHFYCNTYSFILGRDVRAARAAHQRELQVRQVMRHTRAKSSSGGNTSHTPIRMKHEGSGIIGSVVSDRGGIMGFDPDVPPHLPSRISRRSSNSSHAELGAPMHATPAQLQSNTTDYNALAMESLNDEGGDAKPVDALALLPSPDSCPTIPIHPPATTDGSAAGHRGISRKHVKIAYNFDKNLFEMEVMGRNGAFIGADWLSPGQIRPLHSGDYIQIGGVRIRFLLPDVPIGETGADRVEEPYVAEEENAQASVPATENDEDEKRRKSESTENKDAPKTTKIILKTKEPDSSRPVPSIESSADGQQPMRRRGPGRPPKDGIMSKRERAELAREQKLAAKREANGGVTPPPANRPKAGKTTTTSTVATTPKESTGGDSPGSKPEKRKYTKRKKPDGTLMDFPLPSTEGGQFPMDQRPEDFIKAPPVKKRKPSRSPSPNYPPESAYTPEDLAKPPYNYAVLIFDALTEAGTPMTLKQIYRALKLKYPYFRFKCETEGWTSSVRHNLNGNSHLFMHAERDGKGWSWQLRPGASVEKEKKRRPSPPPPSQPPPMPAAPQYMPPMNPAYSNPTNGQANMANPHFQFPSMPSNPYPAPSPAPTPTPAPQQSSPYPPPSQPAASTPFPIPSPLRNNLPPAFAQTTPSTYTSPYASDPPPQLIQYQQSQQQTMQAQPQHHSPYPPANPPPPPPPPMSMNPPSQNLPPNPGPPMQHQPNLGVAPGEPSSGPMDTSETSSFNDRANKAIDDFEAVLMEDYEDKNYIREVLKSARARVLGQATESSFPGGEPKDEAVILDALRGLVGGLKDE
ncbi:unnamed protein product [Aspergillus oryzae RIB40]|uniref:DNA, SC003 n=2 Tax=Aspergillus oryzae TaxID=5062 RepID=Q2UL62_ASPOR|nr:unnamed protein product [Aspergillus oryzae RIB40]BAE57703.1 unnamed protein product [Aspergillus oryzae RIB40]GMG01294.1 unnamed protein product [Aspergillus oryzae]GMG51789.1 unnamed protein product [Aspergillus oryzae var. brunneus]